MQSLLTTLGILSAFIFIACDIPYLSDTLKGKTKPHRVTWGVVALLNCISFANQLASGATNSLWLFGTAAVMVTSIFIVSLFKGVGGHSRMDIFSVIASLAGIGLWLAFDSPWFSIIANIFVAIVALVPTYIKAAKDPESETRIAWLGGTISVFLAALSVGELNLQLLILPVVSTILQGVMVYILYVRPARAKER